MMSTKEQVQQKKKKVGDITEKIMYLSLQGKSPTMTDQCSYQRPYDEAECYESSVTGEEAPYKVSQIWNDPYQGDCIDASHLELELMARRRS